MKLTTKQATDFLGLQGRQIENLCKQGRIKFTLSKTGRRIFDSDNLTIAPSHTELKQQSRQADKQSVTSDNVLSAKQVAYMFNVSPQTIYSWVKNGRIEVIPSDNGKIRFDSNNLTIKPSSRNRKNFDRSEIVMPKDKEKSGNVILVTEDIVNNLLIKDLTKVFGEPMETIEALEDFDISNQSFVNLIKKMMNDRIDNFFSPVLELN